MVAHKSNDFIYFMHRKRGIMCVTEKMVKLWIESTKILTTRLLKGIPRED